MSFFLNDYRNGYKQIQKFMKQNGFVHRQKSGYLSKTKITDADVLKFISSLSIQFPWLSPCVQKFDVSYIGTQYSVLPIIHNPIQTSTLTKTASSQNQFNNTPTATPSNIIKFNTEEHEHER